MPAKQEPRTAQRKKLEGLQARLDTSEARTRQREDKLEDVPAAVEVGLEDARTAAETQMHDGAR